MNRREFFTLSACAAAAAILPSPDELPPERVFDARATDFGGTRRGMSVLVCTEQRLEAHIFPANGKWGIEPNKVWVCE